MTLATLLILIVLLVTLATLQVLRCRGVEAVHGEYLPHVLVYATGRQALAIADMTV